MAEQMELNTSGLQEVANAIRGPGNAHKRKRDSDGNEAGRSMKRISPVDANGAGNPLEALQDYAPMHPEQNGNSDQVDTASSTATAALALYPAITIPPRTEDAFAAQTTGDDRDDDAFIDSQGGDAYLDTPTGADGTPRSANKPPVGSDEWHKIRKDNHKEVERRRRETINEGINELAKIVPGCEKNKGSILSRAVAFIVQLKDNETQNIEKWTLEKLLTEQAIAELSASNDKLKAENERAWREVETWKKTCQSAGLAPKKETMMTEE